MGRREGLLSSAVGLLSGRVSAAGGSAGQIWISVLTTDFVSFFFFLPSSLLPSCYLLLFSFLVICSSFHIVRAWTVPNFIIAQFQYGAHQWLLVQNRPFDFECWPLVFGLRVPAASWQWVGLPASWCNGRTLCAKSHVRTPCREMFATENAGCFLRNAHDGFKSREGKLRRLLR